MKANTAAPAVHRKITSRMKRDGGIITTQCFCCGKTVYLTGHWHVSRITFEQTQLLCPWDCGAFITVFNKKEEVETYAE